MKRYNLQGTVIQHWPPDKTGPTTESNMHMEEAPDGKWVRYEEAAAALREAESRIPEVRIERLEKALGLIAKGCCPECGLKVQDWKPPCGSFAPEAWAMLKERGIDAGTGHKITCSRRNNT